MSWRKLEVGTVVQFELAAEAGGTRTQAFRIEQHLACEDGRVLYRIKSEAGPLDRVVCEHDLDPRA